MRRGFAHPLFVLVVATGVMALTALACDSFDTADSAANAPDDAASSTDTATGADAPPPSDGSLVDAGRDTLGDATVVFYSDFEGTSSQCPGWNVLSGSATPTPLARTGNLGCLVCAMYQGAAVNIRKQSDFAPGRHVLTFYSRRPPDDAGDAGPRAAPGVIAALSVYNADGGVLAANLPLQDIHESYEPHTLVLDVTDAGSAGWTGVQAYIAGSGTPGECFIVDDVLLTRE